MTKEETSHYAIQAVTRSMIREDFNAKLGRIEYSITKYQRLIRALIPFGYESNKLFILLSFDVGSNPVEVIENKVTSYLRNHYSNYYGDMNATSDLKNDHMIVRRLGNIAHNCSIKLYLNEGIPLEDIEVILVIIE